MAVSKEAQAYIDMCFKHGSPVGIQPSFGVKYENASDYKFTEKLLAEMLSSGRVKVIAQNEKNVTLMGIK